MSLPIPLGQYVQGDSVVHRLEPRAKLAVMTALITMLFVSTGWWPLAIVGSLVVAGALLAGAGIDRMAHGLRPVLIVLAFTIGLNAIRLDATDPLFSIGPIDISSGGLQRGAYFALRIVALVLVTTLLTLTTSPVALTDAISRLLRPFEPIGLPATDVAMMLSIAMRFVPTTAEEADRIVIAQAARGARFDSGGPIARARAYVPVMVPLFVNLFRRAEDLALAMEARAYRGRGRTQLRDSKMRTVDWIAVGLSVVGVALVAVYL